MVKGNVLLERISFLCHWCCYVVKRRILPNSKFTVKRDKPVYIPFYDFCGSYNISAEVFSGLECSVNFSLYPIPNWLIAGDGKGCSVSRKS